MVNGQFGLYVKRLPQMKTSGRRCDQSLLCKIQSTNYDTHSYQVRTVLSSPSQELQRIRASTQATRVERVRQSKMKQAGNQKPVLWKSHVFFLN
jgi:hypothetical protein